MNVLDTLRNWFYGTQSICGAPDTLRLAAEAPSRWASTHLKWYVESRPPGVGITDATYGAEVATAFSRWHDVCAPLTFEKTFERGSANVILRVGRGPEFGFPPKTGIVANALMPNNDHFAGQLPVTLNGDKVWVIKQAFSGGVILLPQLLHEIGHVLGLPHSTRSDQCMTSGSPYDRPQDEDIARIRALYGVPVVPVPPIPIPAPTFIRSRVEAYNRVYEGNLPLTN